MKNVIYFLILTFSICSCSEEALQTPIYDDNQISKREIKRDCDVVFTEGNAYDIFGQSNIGEFENGWQGSFEQALFPCPEIGIAGDCCVGQSEIVWYDVYIPISTTCNEILSVEEQQIIYETIQNVALENPPRCTDGYLMEPVAYDILVWNTLCCSGLSSPCVMGEIDPCDCYDQFPDDDYFACCESYTIFLAVKYAYNGPCFEPFNP